MLLFAFNGNVTYICSAWRFHFILLIVIFILQGQLTLANTRDSSKHKFDLVGFAERPCAQDTIFLQAIVGKRYLEYDVPY